MHNNNNLINNPSELKKRLRDINNLSVSSSKLDEGREKENYKLLMKAFNSKTTSPHTQLLYSSNSITYKFSKNNIANISSTKKVDVLIKNFFLSLFTLISKPFYIDRQDKLVIRLFIYVAPKLEKNKLIRSLKNRNIRIKDQLGLISGNSGQISTETEGVGRILKGLTPSLNNSNPLLFSSVHSSKDLKAQVDNNNIFHSLSPRNTYLNIFKTQFENLSLILGKYFKKQIEFEIIRLQYPFHDSNILSQILAYNAKKYNLRRM